MKFNLFKLFSKNYYKFYDLNAGKYDFDAKGTLSYVRKKLSERVSKYEDFSSLMDVGAGTGESLVVVKKANKNPQKIIAIEPSIELLKIAKNKNKNLICINSEAQSMYDSMGPHRPVHPFGVPEVGVPIKPVGSLRSPTMSPWSYPSPPYFPFGEIEGRGFSGPHDKNVFYVKKIQYFSIIFLIIY